MGRRLNRWAVLPAALLPVAVSAQAEIRPSSQAR